MVRPQINRWYSSKEYAPALLLRLTDRCLSAIVEALSKDAMDGERTERGEEVCLIYVREAACWDGAAAAEQLTTHTTTWTEKDEGTRIASLSFSESNRRLS